MTKKNAAVIWMGEAKCCDICKKPFGRYFVDGRTMAGVAALMCEKCHSEVGMGLGIGHGQKYVTRTKKGVAGFELRAADVCCDFLRLIG